MLGKSGEQSCSFQVVAFVLYLEVVLAWANLHLAHIGHTVKRVNEMVSLSA